MIFKQFMFTGMSNNMGIKHQCITPMFNIHVEEDIKMKHFSIFKTRSMQEIRKLGFRIEGTKYDNFALEPLTKWPLLLCEMTNPIRNEKTFHDMLFQIEKFYDILLLFEHNIHSPLVTGPVFGSTTIDHSLIFSTFYGFVSSEYIKDKIELSQNRMLDFDKAFEQLEPILFHDHDNKILKRVHYAMSWLDKARRLPRFYDRFIFLSIALETLISDQQTGLAYHLSQRAAFLIGETDEQRHILFSKIRNVYKSRSKIIHGEIEFETKNNELFFLQEVVRVLILKMISLRKHYNDPKKLLKDIDEGLFTLRLKNSIINQNNGLFSVCSKFTLL